MNKKRPWAKGFARSSIAALVALATLAGGGGAAWAADAPAPESSPAVSASPQASAASPAAPADGSAALPKADTAPHGDPVPAAPLAASSGVPDVSMTDMLDSDAASVTSLKMDAMTTGTAPFDEDDAAGDDSGAKNAVVRSFDYVSYDYTYMVTPDSPMQYYKSARVGFRFELPYSSDMVAFALDRMNWVDQTPGFHPRSPRRQWTASPRRC